jgi:hypothetical protein
MRLNQLDNSGASFGHAKGPPPRIGHAFAGGAFLRLIRRGELRDASIVEFEVIQLLG